jgi:subtilisin family serine protease
MILRTVPAGDEYDKDVALAIRYAADNGAKIINCSFGKSFSPQRKWVEDAISYAEGKGALIVHAAGNESEDLDVLKNTNYPDDQPNFNTEFASNFLSVGALAPYFNQGLIADFSNYGKEKVDLFAPGEDVYSSMPNDIFAFQGGTSMAAPVVSGVAAWIAAYFPKHQGPALKKILMDSSIRLPINVLTPDNEEINSFARFSKSGGIVNLYNALLLAQNRY